MCVPPVIAGIVTVADAEPLAPVVTVDGLVDKVVPVALSRWNVTVSGDANPVTVARVDAGRALKVVALRTTQGVTLTLAVVWLPALPTAYTVCAPPVVAGTVSEKEADPLVPAVTTPGDVARVVPVALSRWNVICS